MGTKFCSTSVCEALFAKIYTPFVAGGSGFFAVMTSSNITHTIARCTSNSSEVLAWSTKDGPATTGYFTVANDGVDRKMTIAACSCDTVNWTGIASYVAIVAGSSEVLYMTTCTTQELTAGNKVNIGSWTIKVSQPT